MCLAARGRLGVDYGSENLLTGNVQLGSSKYVQTLGGDMEHVTPQAPLFYQQVKERLSLPGVRSVAVASEAYSQPFRVSGRPDPPPEQQPLSWFVEAQVFVGDCGEPVREGKALHVWTREPVDLLVKERDEEGFPRDDFLYLPVDRMPRGGKCL